MSGLGHGSGSLDWKSEGKVHVIVRRAGKRILTLGQELRDNFEVGNRDEGEERHEDHEVDL